MLKNKKLIAQSMVTFQLMTSIIGMSLSRADDPSAEATLLSNAIAIRGDGLSQKAIQQQLESAIKIYQESAPSYGREDRLQQALVQLNIMTSDQATSFRANIDSSVQEKMNDKSEVSQQEANALVSQSVQSVLSNTEGAQFSRCGKKHLAVGLGIGLAGSALLTVGIQNSNQPGNGGQGKGGIGPAMGAASMGEAVSGAVLIIAGIVTATSC